MPGCACIVCGKRNEDWKDPGGFLCTAHWRLVPGDLEVRYRKACTAHMRQRMKWKDPDHPAVDRAWSKAVALYQDCKDAARAEADKKRDLFGRVA